MYRAKRDTREAKGNGWWFAQGIHCEGTTRDGLKTGDYSIVGLEDVFSIERKGSTGEFAQNIVQPRFERELERLNKFKHAFVILEFSLEDVLTFPAKSGIPENKWGLIKISPKFILSKLRTFRLKYSNIVFILAGNKGKDIAEKIMRFVYGQSKKSME